MSNAVSSIDPNLTPGAPAERAEPKIAARSAVPTASTDAVHDYLQKIGTIPLLTAEEEIILAKSIEVGLFAREKLDAEPDLDRAFVAELLTLERQGKAAYQRFVRSNLRLVVNVAKRYAGQGAPFMDLIQDGNLGLDRAVKKFDYKQGYKFSTYAMWWIRQAIARGLSESRLIRVPVHTAERVASVRRTKHQLEIQLGRIPTLEELAEDTGFSPDEVQRYLDADIEPVSIHTPVGDDAGTELGELIEDDGIAPIIDIVGDGIRTEMLRRKVASLPPREAEIIRMRFGLRDEAPMTFTEVGSVLGVSRERVRQIEHRALIRLRCQELRA